MNSHGKLNKIRNALATIASTFRFKLGRVAQANAEQCKLLGKVVTGTHYRHACPIGAGAGPKKHSMDERIEIGSRVFTRRQRRFIKAHKFSAWATMVEKAN